VMYIHSVFGLALPCYRVK